MYRVTTLLSGVILTATLPLSAQPNSTPSTTLASAINRASALPIMPDLRGFGAETVAGSGRHRSPPHAAIMRVRNLQDSGSESLRACVEASTPRTCVFEVGGEITLKRALRIRSPYITIAGQTAPRPGITITRGGFRIETHDVLIQHLAIRPGDSRYGVSPGERDGVSIGGPPPHSAYRVVLDNLSVTWATDENVSTWDPSTRDVTISRSIIAEGLHNSIHPKGPHSKGIMIGDGSQRITLTRNVIALNEERNPYLKPGTSVEMLNNIVYGWGPKGGWSLCNLTDNVGSRAPIVLSFIGNSYIPAPWSAISPPVYAKQIGSQSKIFVEDNRTGQPPARPSRAWDITTLAENRFRASSPPLRSTGPRALSSDDALLVVPGSAGSRPRHRAKADSRIIKNLVRRGGAIRDCISGCRHSVGGWRRPRSTRRALQLPARPFADDNRDGYTNLENWLHRRARRV